MSDPPVQLRLGFQPPKAPAVLELTLAGLIVLVDTPSGRLDDVWQHLGAVGVVARAREDGGLAFNIGHIGRAADLPEFVTVRCDPTLMPLWSLARNRPPAGLPATLERDSTGLLRLRWFDGTYRWDEEINPSIAPALLASELAFVATPDAWEVLKERSHLPVLAGRARLNLDGYIEISTGMPQLVETAPLPGLFRIDETHFGLSVAYADALAAAPGFAWEGRQPRVPASADMVGTLPIPLSNHARVELAELVEVLTGHRCAVIAWDEGLGRRVVALAAVETLDAYPLLVVCPPASLWLWRRQLAAFNRQGSRTPCHAETRVVTYAELAAGTPLEDFAAVIFDDLDEAASMPRSRAACRRLDSMNDAYRIGVAGAWPTPLAAQLAVMAVVRPGEFRDDIPVEVRYPGRPAERAAEHIAAYLRRRRAGDPSNDVSSANPSVFPRADVIRVELNEEQQRALARLAGDRSRRPAMVLADVNEVIGAGPVHATSPKLAAVVDTARTGLAAGRRVAIVTRSSRAATMLSMLLRPTRTVVVDGSDGPLVGAASAAQAVIVRFDATIPDLTTFDEVIVADYPTSFASLDVALGGVIRGVRRVVVIHADASADDMLAVLAADRPGVVDDVWSDADAVTVLTAPR